MAIGFVSSVKLGFITLRVDLFILAVFVAMSVLAAWWPPAVVVPIAYIALLAHEVAHATVYRRAFGAQSTISLFHVMTGHTSTPLPRPPTVREQTTYYLAGPLTGLACGAILLVVSLVAGLAWPFWVGGIGIMIQHGINLLPFKDGSDGSRLKDLL